MPNTFQPRLVFENRLNILSENWEFTGRNLILKFMYSEKATKFCKISTLLLSYEVPVKSKVEISQNFVAFSEYMNFTYMSGRKSIGTGKFLIICIYKPLYLEQHKQMNQFL